MRYPIMLAIAAALAACGSGTEDAAGGDALSSEEVAERAEEAIRLEPGQYRSTADLVSIDIPGAPPEVVEMMKRSMSAESSVTEYCLTPEDVEKGYEEMARNSAEGDCSFSRFDVDGGDIDAEMVCQGGPQGAEARMTLTGSGTSTSSDMTMTMRMDAAGMGDGTMTVRVRHERIGDCPG